MLFNQNGDLFEFLKSINPDFSVLIKSNIELNKVVNQLNAAKSVILVHNVELENGLIPCQENIYFCLCPNSNMLINNKLPKKELIYNRDYKFVIGTDSLASNSKLCILSEIKTLAKNFPDLDLVDLLTMATSNGAKALKMDGFGSFKIGSKPGVIILENLDLVNLKLNDKTIVKRLF